MGNPCCTHRVMCSAVRYSTSVRPAAENSTPPACAPQMFESSRDLLAELQRAENEQQVRHQNENDKVRPVFKEIGAAQNDRAHERDEICRGKECAERIKN